MKCIIPGPNVKVFGRAIHSLSKMGEELYIEALEHGLALRTVNSSRSAYACFIFAPSFFLHYSDGMDDVASNSSEDDILKYKINMKSCLTVFKSLSNLEKTCDKCKIHLDLKESRLVFQLFCRHGIVKTHNLSFIECETLQAIFSKDTSKNILTAQTKLLCEAVLNFQTTQEEVTLILDASKTRLKNYVDDQTDANKLVHTELTLEPDEFEAYTVGADCQVTFCLKELRAILAFSEPSNLPVSIYFDGPGKMVRHDRFFDPFCNYLRSRPIVFSMDTDPSFEANFVLATLADKNSSVNLSQSASQLQASQRITNTTNSFSEPAASVSKPAASVSKPAAVSKPPAVKKPAAAVKKPPPRPEERQEVPEKAKAGRHVWSSDEHKSSTSKHANNNNSLPRKASATSRLKAASKELCEEDMETNSVTAGGDLHSRRTNHETRADKNTNRSDVKGNKNLDTSRRSDVIDRQSDVTCHSADVKGLSTDVTSRSADVTSRSADVTSRSADVPSRGTDFAGRIADVSLGLPELPRPSAPRPGDGVDNGADEDDDDDVLCSPIIPFQSSRLKEASMSMSRLIVPEDESTTEGESDEDAVPGTPPSKRFRAMLSGLSQSTAGASQTYQRTILAADTDDEDD